jgi:chaperonin GroEL
MKSKEVYLGNSGKERIKAGINKVADAVGVTLGPRGRLVMVEVPGGIIPTKDGVFVARHISLKDKLENIGASLCIHSASKTAETVGDGTTTATLLTQYLVNTGDEVLSSVEITPNDLIRGMDKTLKKVVSSIDRNKIRIDHTNSDIIAAIASVSCNDQEIGATIAEAFRRAGQYGQVTFAVDLERPDVGIKDTPGYIFDIGYMHPHYINDTHRNRCVMEDAAVLIIDKTLQKFEEISPILTEAVTNRKNLLVICDDLIGDAQAGVLNNLQVFAERGLQICFVKAPFLGRERYSALTDISILVGAKYFTADDLTPFQSIKAEHFGECKRVEVNKDSTIIVSPGNEVLDKYISDLLARDGTNEEKDQYKQRASMLSSGVFSVQVGGRTDLEVMERRYRVEDAVFAVKAALRDGAVPGGGIALLNAWKEIIDDEELKNLTSSEKEGSQLLKQAMLVPVTKIANNGGFSGQEILDTLVQGDIGSNGFNVRTGTYENFQDAGILDPSEVVKSAITHAVNVASQYLLTGAVIFDCED